MDADGISIPRPDLSTAMDAVLAESAEQGLRLVWLFGETGQGKTHFLTHYIEAVRARALVSYAQCSSPLGNQSTTVLKPHQPLKDLFEDMLANQASTRRRLNLIKNVSLTVLAMIPVVGEFAYGVKEIRRDLHEFKTGTREVDFSNFVKEYFTDLNAIATETPVLAVIDDVQWADVPTIEALHRFVLEEEYRNTRVTLVLSARRDEVENVPELLSLYSHTGQQRFCSELTVPPFSALQIRDYLRSRFPHVAPQSELLQWLEQKTGGNPFFLTSYIQHLLVEGVLGKQGEIHGDLDTYRGLPAEIRLVNSWLLKSLSDGDLHLLLTASVLGYEFSLHELSHLAQRQALDIIRALRRVKTLYGIVEPSGYKLINGKESTVYRFTQHAIHTALYNELTAEEREVLHRMTAHYLNDLRLTRGTDPDVQNSVASALLLHSRLGRDPELEYQSILLKAQHTPDVLNEQEIQQRLASLAPSIGIPAEQLLESFRQALQLAPLSTRHANREQMVLGLPQEEREMDSLSALLARILGMLRRGSTAEANVVLELHVNKAERRGQRLHPIVHVLYAMSCEMLGRDRELALRSLRVATADTLAPAYATFARLGLALFEEADDTETLRRLKEAAAYSGRHEGILHAVAAWIVSTRFGSREEFHAILAHRHFDVSVSEQLQSLYPNTASLLRGKE